MEPNLAQHHVGVDISKDFLDVALYPAGDSARFPNDAKGIRALIKWLVPRPPARVVFEATGAYHRLLERTLAKAGLPGVKVNPRQARRFAEAIGKLAKTDRCDAAMLARMGPALQVEARPIVSDTLDKMSEFITARDALVKDRTAALTRRHTVRDPSLKAQLAARLRQIDKQITAIEKKLKELRRADPDVQARYEILVSIPCVGDVTAYVLIVFMSELGGLDPGRAACLAGVAPFDNESGKSSGQKSIRGGRARVREALYMAAFSAMTHHPEYSVKYDALIKAGKKSKVALVALMRKLVILANALLRDKRKWTPTAPRREVNTILA
jgi:transposase